MYKGEVMISHLSMVDDVICISECGHKSVMMNSYIQCKTSLKKLQFGSIKCKKLHIGKECVEYNCHPLSSMLCKSEVWFILTGSDMDILETVDLRRLNFFKSDMRKV